MISLKVSAGLPSASLPIFIQNSACALMDRHITALARRTSSCSASSIFTMPKAISMCIWNIYDLYITRSIVSNHPVRSCRVQRSCDWRHEDGARLPRDRQAIFVHGPRRGHLSFRLWPDRDHKVPGLGNASHCSSKAFEVPHCEANSGARPYRTFKTIRQAQPPLYDATRDAVRILLIEDEPRLAESVCATLRKEKFVVDHLDRLATAREAGLMGGFDLVLLDRKLPDGEGLSLVPELRACNPGIRIIVLSACGEVADRVAGLDEGADDYLVKPFAMDEMLARIRAVRRRPAELEGAEIRAGSVIFDLANEEVEVRGGRLDLPRRELRVLAALMKRRGRTVLRETLEQAVYGFDDAVQSNTLDSHISRLRKKLTKSGAGVEIHAIRGVGYLLREAA